MAVLKDKIAVITGASRGLGLAIAEAYTQAGAAVVLASRSAESVQTVVDKLTDTGARASGLACDVADLSQVRALADHAVATFGDFDIWINNAAAAGPYGPVMHIPHASVERVFHTNILGTYYGSLVAMRHFLARGGGKLINISGAGDRRPHPMQTPYSSTKAWLINFTRALAEEYKDSPVGVYVFNPGMMDTELIQNLEAIQGYESRLSSLDKVMQVISKPPQVPAQRAVWLASAETDGKTGLVVRESSPFRLLGSALRAGLDRLFNRPARPIDIRITTIPAALEEKLD